jgi:hypothetical protein
VGWGWAVLGVVEAEEVRGMGGCSATGERELREALDEVDRLVDRVAGLEREIGVRDQQLAVRAATIRRLRSHRYSPGRVRRRRLVRRLALIRHPVRFARAIRRRLERKQGRRASDRALRSGRS